MYTHTHKHREAVDHELELVVKVTTGVDHLAAKKQFGAVQHLTHRQFPVGVLVGELNQVVRLQMCMVLVVRINVYLRQKHATNTARNCAL